MMAGISLYVALGALLATPTAARARSSKPMIDMQKVAYEKALQLNQDDPRAAGPTSHPAAA